MLSLVCGTSVAHYDPNLGTKSESCLYLFLARLLWHSIAPKTQVVKHVNSPVSRVGFTDR